MNGHPTRYTLMFRRQIEVNTDPQRRCYDGCNFSSEMRWTEWAHISHPANKEEGEDSMRTFKRINPGSEYKLLPPTGGERCPWCAADLTQLTGACYCGRVPPPGATRPGVHP